MGKKQRLFAQSCPRVQAAVGAGKGQILHLNTKGKSFSSAQLGLGLTHPTWTPGRAWALTSVTPRHQQGQQ